MRVDRHVPSGAGQRLPLAIGDVHFSLRVAIMLGHSEICGYNVSTMSARNTTSVRANKSVTSETTGCCETMHNHGWAAGHCPLVSSGKPRRTDYVNLVGGLRAGDSNQEVVWLDVAVDEGFLMNGLDARNLHGSVE